MDPDDYGPERERPTVEVLPEYDGTVATGRDLMVVRASALGGCIPGLAMSHLGMREAPPPPEMLEAMKDSASLERQALDLLKDHPSFQGGSAFEWSNNSPAYHEATWWRGKGLLVSGRSDGWFKYYENKVGPLEIKCVGGKTFKDLQSRRYNSVSLTITDPNPLIAKWMWQLGAYSLLSRRVSHFRIDDTLRICGDDENAPADPMLLAVFEKHHGGLTGNLLLFSDNGAIQWALDTGMLSTPDPSVISTRLASVAAMQNPTCPGGSDWCPHYSQHERPKVEVTTRQIMLLELLKRRRKELDGEIKQLTDVISESVRGVGGKAETPDGTKLTWVEQDIEEKEPRKYRREYLKVTLSAKVKDMLEETNESEEDT